MGASLIPFHNLYDMAGNGEWYDKTEEEQDVRV
jgi:hypothetical protein